jgi:3-oxoacyl-[acyl-carrier protein] reductase
MDLAGKAAIVTGAAVGVGRAVALMLAERGANVALNYSRSREDAEATAHAVERSGARALAVKADIRNDAEVRRFVDQAAERFGRLDLLVNNAAITRFVDHADLEGLTDKAWDAIFQTNVRGTFYATRAAVPWIKRSGGGAIVNVSSVAGVYATGSSVAYCASKAAINNMTVALARALAPSIRVNAVAPGFVDTRWWHEREHYEVIKQLAAQAAPLGKVCQPEDVAKVIVDLAEADLVTGQILVIDGGMGIAGGMPPRR